MLERLKNWLNENNMQYKISYGGANKDIENVEVGEFAICEDSGKYLVCHISTANFKWLIFPELTNMLLDRQNEINLNGKQVTVAMVGNPEDTAVNLIHKVMNGKYGKE